MIGHIVDRCPQLAVKAKYIDTLIKVLLLLVLLLLLLLLLFI